MSDSAGRTGDGAAGAGRKPPAAKPNKKSGQRSRWRTIFKTGVAAIGGAVALLGVLVEFFEIVPKTIESGRAAVSYVVGMVGPGGASQPLPGVGAAPAKSETGAPSPQPAVAASSELGPAPNPNCRIFISTDYAVVPPRIERSWKC